MPCDYSSQYFTLKNSPIIIKKNGNKYSVLKNANVEELDFGYKPFDIDLDHDQLLINGVNHLENSAAVKIITEESGDFSVKKTEFNNSQKKEPAYIRLDIFFIKRIENIYFYGLIIIINCFYSNYNNINMVLYDRKLFMLL